MLTVKTAIPAYLRAIQAAPPDGSGPNRASEIATNFEQVMADTDRNAMGSMTGTTDTHALVQSLTEAELALDAAVAIRDKVVEAYQEILRMPV